MKLIVSLRKLKPSSLVEKVRIWLNINLVLTLYCYLPSNICIIDTVTMFSFSYDLTGFFLSKDFKPRQWGLNTENIVMRSTREVFSISSKITQQMYSKYRITKQRRKGLNPLASEQSTTYPTLKKEEGLYASCWRQHGYVLL